MYVRIGILALAIAAIAASGTSPARAELPADRVLSYSIRLDPEEEASAIVFEIDLDISAADIVLDEVQWFVKSAKFTERDVEGDYVRSWRVEHPMLETPDGHWWVYHDEPLDPQVAEFTVPPGMQGTAGALDQGQADLLYSLAPGDLDPSQRYMFEGNVAAISYAFIDWETDLAIEVGEDEPMEVGGDDFDPPVG